MRIHSSFLGLAMLSAVAATLPTQQPSAREVMEQYKAQDRTRDLSAEQTMRLIDRGGGERVRRMTYVTKTGDADNRRMLIQFLAPPDIAGTGFLSVEHSDRDDDRWLYLPALRRTRRIAGSDKTDAFVGSEFTFEDLDSERLELYEYRMLGSETVDGVEAWVVEAVPTDVRKREETGYERRELWISQDHHLMIQAKYYDRSGTYTKRFTARDIRQVGDTDKWRAYVLTMEDVQSGDKTVVEVSAYQIDQGVPDQRFSERYLRRGT